jgi:hypothetical protein
MKTRIPNRAEVEHVHQQLLTGRTTDPVIRTEHVAATMIATAIDVLSRLCWKSRNSPWRR